MEVDSEADEQTTEIPEEQVVPNPQDVEQDDRDFEAFLSFLDISQERDEELIWVARQAYVAPLPPGWSEFADSEGRIYFYNFVTEQSSWAHPMDVVYKDVIRVIRDVTSQDTSAKKLSAEEKMAILHQHLQAVHEEALTAIKPFSGPYTSDDGHEYYYNEETSVSTWESPVAEWEYNMKLRWDVLYRVLILKQQVENTSPTRFELPLHLVVPQKDNFEPATPSTSRSFHTVRSNDASARWSSRRSPRDVKPPKSAIKEAENEDDYDDDDAESVKSAFDFTFGVSDDPRMSSKASCATEDSALSGS